ncbi:MAG: acyl-CoA dehydratase activase [Nanoarchaeota archaeon]
MQNIGIDAGAGNINIVLSDGDQKIKFLSKKVSSSPVNQTLEVLSELTNGDQYKIGITGSNGRAISKITGIPYISDSSAIMAGLKEFPDARTVFDLGRERSALYKLKRTQDGFFLEDFASNSVCGAGAGALIEKMAKRLQFQSLDEFVSSALTEDPAYLAGRCAVLLESDVVHGYQKLVSAGKISSGLCSILARNFSTYVIGKKEIEAPIYMVGGVSKNKAVVNYLVQKFKKKITVPENADNIKAYGVSLSDNLLELEISELSQRLKNYNIINEIKNFHQPLKLVGNHSSELPYIKIEDSNGKVLLSYQNYQFPSSERVDCYLGLDVGSVSTKLALIDKKNNAFILGLYLRTGGNSVRAVKNICEILGNLEFNGKKIKNMVNIIESGTTGSGRKVAKEIIGAGIAIDEITAQSQGTIYFFPEADTIFEIGGQDSKFISLKDRDYEMNKNCSASTGSFLEEQARILGINIEKEFSSNALASEKPCILSDKCAIFMSSSLLAYQQFPLEDRCAGLSYAICNNYLNRVAKLNKIGKKISFQGAVSFNLGVVAGFENILGQSINVPDYPHLTGAIGTAVIAKEFYEGGKYGIYRI